MGTYAEQVALGEGDWMYAAEAEGWPEVWVSHSALVKTLSDGRERILGLDPKSLRFAAEVDLVRADPISTEQALSILNDTEIVRAFALEGATTASLSKAPSNTTFLTADLTASATTATVASTAGFPTSGAIHLATEAIGYTGKTATTFTGLSRGKWGTKAQAHFTRDGERLGFPTVTDRPRTLRGRRMLFRMWGAADDPDGNGTIRWRGVVSTDVSHDGDRYSFSVEPPTFILEQPVGGDIEEPVPISGIYLPSSSPLSLTISRYATAGYAGASPVETAIVLLSGHWDTQDEFCAALTTALGSATASWTWSSGAALVAQPLGQGGWQLIYRVGSTAEFVSVQGGATFTSDDGSSETGASYVDHFVLPVGSLGGTWRSLTNPEADVSTLTANAAFFIDFSAPVPRAVFGHRGSEPGPADSGSTFPSNRIYLGGNVVPNDQMMAAIVADGGDDDVELTYATAVNVSERYIEVATRPAMQLGPTTKIRLGRLLAFDSTLETMLLNLTTDSPNLVNAGAMPLIRLGSATAQGDLALLPTDLTRAERGSRIASRTWVASEGTTLREILSPEALLRNLLYVPDKTGLIDWLIVRPPLKTDVTAFELDASNIVGNKPAVSRAPQGHLREVAFRQGWDPIENEHRGLTIRVRSAEGVDPTTLGGVLEVAPRSAATLRGDAGLEIDPLDAELMGRARLGLFGGAYRLITLEANMTLFEFKLGDTGVITSAHIPSQDGTMGLTQKECTLVGFDWVPEDNKGTLQLLTTELNIGGYSPGFLVASQSGSGTSWTLTLTLSGYTDETDVATWFAVGDEVRVVQRDSVSPTRVTGTVTSIPSTTQLAVTFDATWTPGSDSWWFGYDTTANVDEAAPSGRRWAQADFAKVGGTDGKAALASGDVDAEDFSP